MEKTLPASPLKWVKRRTKPSDKREGGACTFRPPNVYKSSRLGQIGTARRSPPNNIFSRRSSTTGPIMLQSSGAFALAVTALLVCCTADSLQDSEGYDGDHSSGRYDAGEKTQDMDNKSSTSIVREVRETQPYFGLLPYMMTRRHDHASSSNIGVNGKREQWPSRKFNGYNEVGYLKRNFDEIDLSGLNNFVRKRNFDEIDHTWLPFPLHKRSNHYYGTNFLDTAVSGLDKKRYKPDYPMDEIDLSSFPIGSKRSQHVLLVR
ncbi:hypothetical protein evm_003197 [Chilo suppressalis]|nr:hypothetical protein evm_003197 [Chilo suppressalis]